MPENYVFKLVLIKLIKKTSPCLDSVIIYIYIYIVVTTKLLVVTTLYSIYIYIQHIYSMHTFLYTVFYFYFSLYLYVPDEGSLLPKFRGCTISNDFELYILYIYIYTIYSSYDESIKRNQCSIS